MSTSLLYHEFGIRGYTYTRTAFDGGTIHFAIDQRDGVRLCSWFLRAGLETKNKNQKQILTPHSADPTLR